jgi:hypothetical protein
VTPRVARMTRIVLGLAVLFLLSACTSESGSAGAGDPEDSPDARTVKTDVDTEAEVLLPDLLDRLGGRLNGMQATFLERGGFGIWDYTAAGALIRPSGTTSQSLAAVRDVLEQHDYSVEVNDSQKRVTGTKGEVYVIVEASLLSAEEKGSGLNVRMGSSGISDANGFAESVPPEDYLAYVEQSAG